MHAAIEAGDHEADRGPGLERFAHMYTHVSALHATIPLRSQARSEVGVTHWARRIEEALDFLDGMI